MGYLIPNGSDQLEVVERQPADRNPAAVYLAGLRAGPGRATMKQALDTIARLASNDQADAMTFPWPGLRFQHTAAIRSKLADRYAPATTNKMLCALRGTLRSAWRLGQMSAEDYHKAADLKAVRGQTVPAGRELVGGEIAALLQACETDASAAGARDAALIALLYATGLRRDEAIGLDLEDYDQQAGKLLVRGKGGKERNVYAASGAADALRDWICVRGAEFGPLFWPVSKGGRLQPRRMTAQALYAMLQRRGRQAGVQHFSCHDLRRTFVGDLLDRGADITTVAKMAGHANVQTTARYDRRPEEAKRKASELLHIPYRRRG